MARTTPTGAEGQELAVDQDVLISMGSGPDRGATVRGVIRELHAQTVTVEDGHGARRSALHEHVSPYRPERADPPRRHVSTMDVAIGERLDLPGATEVELIRVDSEDGKRWALVTGMPDGYWSWSLYTEDPEESPGFRHYSSGSQRDAESTTESRAQVLRSVWRQLRRRA